MKRPSVGIMLAILTASAVQPALAQSGVLGASAEEQPRLINAAEVQAAFGQHYPAALRRKGVAGVAQMRLFIAAHGAADSVQLRGGTGSRELDRAADAIARVMRFSPAQDSGEVRGVWLDLPVAFQPPTMIPSPSTNTIALADRAESERMIRDWRPRGRVIANVTWSTELWVEIDAAGAVVAAELETPTCVDEVNQAAERLARALRFQPEGPGAVAGWTTLRLRLNAGDDSTRVVTLEGTKPPPLPLSGPVKTKAPVLLNRDAVTREITQNLPKHYMGRGFVKSGRVWVKVDEKGAPLRLMLRESTGDCQLDMIALSAARKMRFRPGEQEGKPVVIWAEFPVNIRASM